jgi:hypothetical protein
MILDIYQLGQRLDLYEPLRHNLAQVKSSLQQAALMAGSPTGGPWAWPSLKSGNS